MGKSIMKNKNYLDSSKKSKRKKTKLILALIIMSISISTPSFAQYQITKHTINSGGAQNMSEDSYQVSASIGQVDASNTLIGGTYSVTGGFWNKATNTTELIFINSFE